MDPFDSQNAYGWAKALEDGLVEGEAYLVTTIGDAGGTEVNPRVFSSARDRDMPAIARDLRESPSVHFGARGKPRSDSPQALPA